MSHFELIAEEIDVAPLLAELDANPDLWNHRPERRAGNSPHRETQDIWVRYASEEAMRAPNFSQLPHVSVWWPAARVLPSLMDVVMQVMDAIEVPLEVGGFLLTKIPAGKEVYLHNDKGSWHAEHYCLKVWIPLRANDHCVNHVLDESMVWGVGQAWSHDNLLDHRVENGGKTERICLILCFCPC